MGHFPHTDNAPHPPAACSSREPDRPSVISGCCRAGVRCNPGGSPRAATTASSLAELGPSLLIPASLVLAIRTAKWPPRSSGGTTSDRDLDVGIENPIHLAGRVLSSLVSRWPQRKRRGNRISLSAKGPLGSLKRSAPRRVSSCTPNRKSHSVRVRGVQFRSELRSTCCRALMRRLWTNGESPEVSTPCSPNERRSWNIAP